MPNDYTVVNTLTSTLEGDAKDWTDFFVDYMRKNYPELPEVVSFQMPTFKLGSGENRHYIAFSTAKAHFSMHSMDFDYMAELKSRLKNGGKGKGCVNVKYTDVQEREVLISAIKDIVARTDVR